MTPRIFYQSSMPRAGSTLLQNILAQNPDFYVTPTSGLLGLVLAARQHYTTAEVFKIQERALMKKAFSGFTRGGMESYFKALTDKPYVIDKSRGWGVLFDLLSMLFDEDPKIICMVRDLRQILASAEKIYRQDPDLNRVIKGLDNFGGTTTFKRAMIHLQSPPIGFSLDSLMEIFQRGWDKKMLFLRFEDLTTEPAQTMRRVYSYLEIPEFEHDFDHVPQATHEDDDLIGASGMHVIRPTVEPYQNDYIAMLGREAVMQAQARCSWYFKQFGYQFLA